VRLRRIFLIRAHYHSSRQRLVLMGASATSELKWNELTKKRYEKTVAEACERYKALTAGKKELERKKVAARDKLDTYSGDVCEKYQKAINRYLKRFNAGFHLAFFLAEIEADASKADCIVVFDDPFNSQDHFRRTCTATEIKRCGETVSQVVVMSHDRGFLRDLWDLPLPTADRKLLWLIPFGHKDTVIAEWPIETDTESEDAANRRVLQSFHLHHKGRPRDVIQKLRPVLETHMQRVAPQLLGGVKGLGNMLGKVREANSPPILVDAYADIDDINTYTRRYMHGEGRNPDGEPVHTTELEGMVAKVLEIAGALAEPT
jgi:hypothetical protein